MAPLTSPAVTVAGTNTGGRAREPTDFITAATGPLSRFRAVPDASHLVLLATVEHRGPTSWAPRQAGPKGQPHAQDGCSPPSCR